jgi:hypothetical protein
MSDLPCTIHTYSLCNKIIWATLIWGTQDTLTSSTSINEPALSPPLGFTPILSLTSPRSVVQRTPLPEGIELIR